MSINTQLETQSLNLVEVKNELTAYSNKILSYTNALGSLTKKHCPPDFELYLQRVSTATRKLLALIELMLNQPYFQNRKLDAAKLRHDAGNILNQIIGYAEILQENAEGYGETECAYQLQQILNLALSVLGEINQIPGASSQDKLELDAF